jgi:hypothetical protein
MPVQRLNRDARDEVYRRTLAAVRDSLGLADDCDLSDLAGHCLDFAWEGYRVLKTWPGAPRTLIQAGSAQWPRVPPELDDGISHTHFAYQWDPQSALVRLAWEGIHAVRPGDPFRVILPEIHVWLGCPDTQEVIDLTTGTWPLACARQLGLDWPGPLPPTYFWDFGTRRPTGVNYLPDREAIDLVVALLRRQGRNYP